MVSSVNQRMHPKWQAQQKKKHFKKIIINKK